MKSKVGKFHDVMVEIDAVIESIGSVLLVLVPLIILVAGAGVMVNALFDLKDTNERLIVAVESAVKELRQAGGKCGRVKIDPNQSVYLQQLKLRSRSMLDSNTISFLFQIFALALVSAGAYVLARAQKNLRKAEEATKRVARIGKRVGPFVSNQAASSTLASYFVVALEESRYLGSLTDKSVWASCKAGTFESLTQLKVELKRAWEEKRGMERSQFDIFLDQVAAIKNNLGKVEGVEDLIVICKECEDILKEGEFVKRYEVKLKGLYDDSDEYNC